MDDVSRGPSGFSNGVLYCYGGCGTRYEDFPCDMVLPNALWNRIAVCGPFNDKPEGTEHEGRGGVLCPTCIVKRLSALPECTVVYAGLAPAALDRAEEAAMLRGLADMIEGTIVPLPAAEGRQPEPKCVDQTDVVVPLKTVQKQ